MDVSAPAEEIASRPSERRAPALAVAVVLALSVIGTALAVWEAVSPFMPHVFFGVRIDQGARVGRVFPAELPPGLEIAVGDPVLEHADGDVMRGYRLAVPRSGDIIHVATRHGVVALRAQRTYYPRPDAVGEALRHATGALMILIAALLFVRRPGTMAFAFWIWAISEVGDFNLDVALESFPRAATLVVSIAMWALFNNSGLALIPFALRFPGGGVPAGLRWLDVTAWFALGASFVMGLTQIYRFYAGYAAPLMAVSDLLIPFVMLGAVAILFWKRGRSDARERSRITWASTAFLGAAVTRAAALAIAIDAFGLFAGQHFSWRLLLAIANLCPLLAVYPILRYRLFDLGFVVNRATLYSALTLAAFGTLAAANWVAQHFVTDRLAFVLQPIAAIVIGLGYFRVRNWAQHVIERLLFRERFAAEERLEAMVRGLAFVERSASVDDVLVTEVPRTLHLASAALFRLAGERFERGPALGWPAATLSSFPRDDSLARAIQADGPLVSLRTADWRPAALPRAPADPAFALGILRRGVLSAIVLYGRHANGTEVEPDMLALVRRIGAAAALAYETSEVTALRERVHVLEERLQQTEIRDAEMFGGGASH